MTLHEAGRLRRLLAQLIKVNVMMTLEYRAAFFIYMLNAAAQPAMSLLVWLAVAGASGDALPLGRAHLVTYYVMMGIVGVVVGTWGAPYLAADIRNGDLSKDLMKPAPLVFVAIGNYVGEKIVKLGMLLPLVALLGWLFRDSLRLPVEPWRWLLFLLALVIAASLTYLMDFVQGLLAFWIQDVSGVLALEDLLEKLMAGRFIPLAFFPPALAPLLLVLPWRYTLSFPLEVLTGTLTAGALAVGFAWQMGWCAAMWLMYRVLWRYGLRAYAAAGA